MEGSLWFMISSNKNLFWKKPHNGSICELSMVSITIFRIVSKFRLNLLEIKNKIWRQSFS